MLITLWRICLTADTSGHPWPLQCFQSANYTHINMFCVLCSVYSNALLRVHFKILLFVLKSLNGLALPYISGLLHSDSPSRLITWAYQLLLDVPRTQQRLCTSLNQLLRSTFSAWLVTQVDFIIFILLFLLRFAFLLCIFIHAFNLSCILFNIYLILMLTWYWLYDMASLLCWSQHVVHAAQRYIFPKDTQSSIFKAQGYRIKVHNSCFFPHTGYM